MPRTTNNPEADMAEFMKWARQKPSGGEGKLEPPAEEAQRKPAIAPNVSGLPDPLGDLVRGGTGSLFGRHTLGRHLTDEEMNWAQRAGRGIGKGMAGDVVGARSIAGKYVSGLNELLAKIPESAPLKRGYRSMKEFSAQPDTSIAESVGRVGGAAAPFMAMAPLEEAAAGTATAMAPASAASWVYPAMRSMAGAGVGGMAGAVQSPENPEAGALPGMIGGATGPIASSVFRSPWGRWLGGIGLTEALYKGLSWASGDRLPYYPIGVSILWHSSPFGKKLRVRGNQITDLAGRLIGTIPSGLVGAAGGQLGKGVTSDEQ